MGVTLKHKDEDPSEPGQHTEHSEHAEHIHLQKAAEAPHLKSAIAAQKLATRRGTMMPPKKPTKAALEAQEAKRQNWIFKWWEKASIKYAFSHPYVRSRLEKLMGSNVVSLTDREYMQRLQVRILEDYATAMGKRITVRETEEMERVKNLVLTGKIPLDQAPPEMANHPVRLIELYCQKLIAERRAKMKLWKVHIPRQLYWDDTPDPPSGLSIEKGHVFRKADERLCHPPDTFIEATDEDDIENGYMFDDEEFAKLRYENPLITKLRECQTVEELYMLADEIIGALADIDDVSTMPEGTAVGNV